MTKRSLPNDFNSGELENSADDEIKNLLREIKEQNVTISIVQQDILKLAKKHFEHQQEIIHQLKRTKYETDETTSASLLAHQLPQPYQSLSQDHPKTLASESYRTKILQRFSPEIERSSYSQPIVMGEKSPAAFCSYHTRILFAWNESDIANQQFSLLLSDLERERDKISQLTNEDMTKVLRVLALWFRSEDENKQRIAYSLLAACQEYFPLLFESFERERRESQNVAYINSDLTQPVQTQEFASFPRPQTPRKLSYERNVSPLPSLNLLF